MKRGRMAGLALAVSLMLTGCSGFTPDTNGVSIDEKGVVTEFAREDFGQAYYDKEELENAIDTEVAVYNVNAGTDAVRKKSFRVKDGVAELRMTYATAEDYASFNGVDFYLGDIPGAVQAGYVFDKKFAPVSNGTVMLDSLVWGSGIMVGANYHTVALREQMLVKVPGTIRYVSENVRVTDKSTAIVEESGTAYILYE